jgi:hypothetical protein
MAFFEHRSILAMKILDNKKLEEMRLRAVLGLSVYRTPILYLRISPPAREGCG